MAPPSSTMTPDAPPLHPSGYVFQSHTASKQHARINSQQTPRDPNRTLSPNTLGVFCLQKPEGSPAKSCGHQRCAAHKLLRTKEADLGPDGSRGVHSNCSLPSQQPSWLLHRDPRPHPTRPALYVPPLISNASSPHRVPTVPPPLFTESLLPCPV